jgi:hypothetical protein
MNSEVGLKSRKKCVRRLSIFTLAVVLSAGLIFSGCGGGGGGGSGNSISITTTSLPSGTVGVTYNSSLAASGGNTPYSWSVTNGSLPSGLSLNTSGIISGTPITTGTYNFTVQVKDSSTPQQTASKALSISISVGGGTSISITTTSLPSGTVGVTYNSSLSATGGQTPYSWSVIDGSLPSGLSLNTSGTISGTPTTAGTYNFTVQVSDSSSPPQTASKALSISISSGGGPADPIVILDSPSDNSIIGLVVTFKWRIENPKSGEIYYSKVITDKGVNPFDGGYEDIFDAGTQTEITVTLDESRYEGASFQWGVLVENSTGSERYTSEIWNLHVE